LDSLGVEGIRRIGDIVVTVEEVLRFRIGIEGGVTEILWREVKGLWRRRDMTRPAWISERSCVDIHVRGESCEAGMWIGGY
jgi:hypothetical protein